MLLGSIVYFLLYKLIVHPLDLATIQLDQALRGEKDVINVKFNFEPFEKLISNVNSAISRMGNAQAQNLQVVDRNGEASNMVRIVSDAAFALDSRMKFLEVNEAFGDLTGMRQLTLQGQGLDTLSDQALKLQLEDLAAKAQSAMGTIIQGELDMSGIAHDFFVMASPDSLRPTEVSFIFGTIKKRGTP